MATDNSSAPVRSTTTSTNNQELLENVVMNDTANGQYIQSSHHQLLTAQDLLQHNGLVVDLSGSDFIPVNYPADALFPADLTEEDRNLAAALVAVQLSQQHKQHQQLNDVSALSSLGGKILDQQLILSDNLYIDKQGLVKLNGTEGFENGTTQNFNRSNNNGTSNDTVLVPLKADEESKKETGDSIAKQEKRKTSLPHKKRISKRLRNKTTALLEQQYQCNLCQQKFTNSTEMVRHSILCQTTITPIIAAKPESTTEVHAKSIMFSCQLCSSTDFSDQLRFFEHLKFHYEPETVVVRSQSNHNNNNHNSTNRIYVCEVCKRTFKKQKFYDQHIKHYHQQPIAMINNEFSEPEDLMDGINVVMSDEDDEDSNPTQQKSLVTKWYQNTDDLNQTVEDLKDLDVVEEEVEEVEAHFNCNFCKLQLESRDLLLEHMNTCEGDKNRNGTKGGRKLPQTFNCSECNRSFTHRNSLVYHLRGHSGIRPHQCEECGKSFFASSALKVHQRLHSGDRPYHCEECGRQFRQWGDLKYHMTSLHSTEKQFQCEYCGKDFARKYSLIVHRRIHTGEKNYKCDFCGKTFRASSYLQNHRRIHTGEKPHKCDVCGKPFRVRSDMKRHQKTHHPKRIVTSAQKSPPPLRHYNATDDRLIVEKTKDATNILTHDDNTAAQLLYDTDNLNSPVRETSTLYSNGHQLFLVSYTAATDVKDVEATAWIQTNSS